MENNLYSNLVNFYNVNDENFKEFMAEIYKEMLTTHRDVQYVKEHLTEEIEKKLEIYLVDGKFNINIEEKVNEFLENNQEIKNITLELDTKVTYTTNIETLKEGNYKIGDIVKTMGYYNVNDGGSGIYVVTDSDKIVDNGSIILLDNGLKCELIITNNSVNTSQFGIIKDNNNNDTQLKNLVKFCSSSKIKLFVDNFIKITEPIIINDFVEIVGNGKQTGFYTDENISELIRIEFKNSNTESYHLERLSISNITLQGNYKTSDTLINTIHGITFNSVICLYNVLDTIYFRNLSGSCINIINDGSRVNKRFYSHNIRWEKLYSTSCSEFIYQNTVNSGGIPWVYGGVITDIHIEKEHSFRNNVKFIMDLKGFRNVEIRDIIVEGWLINSREGVIYSDNTLTFEQVYFEIVPKSSSISVEYSFVLDTRQLWNISNIFNLGKIYVKNKGGIVNINNTGVVKNTLETFIGDGKFIINGITIGSWHSNDIRSDIIKNPVLSNVEIGSIVVGDTPFNIEYTEPFYTLNKEEYANKSLSHSAVKYFCPNTPPNITLENDKLYGKVLKIVSTNDKKRVFNGLSIELPTELKGNKIIAVAKFKWVSTSIHKTDTRLLGSSYNILVDTSTPTNDKWITSVGIWDIGNINYVRFDYDDGKVANENQTLYIADIKIYIGNKFDISY